MPISHYKATRSPTGARYKKSYRKSKLRDLGSGPTNTKLGATKHKMERVLGGHHKVRALASEFAFITDPKTKKVIKAKIKTVLETPANKNYARRNIITRGTIIDTEAGKARVTSRPGQVATVSGVLL